MNWGKKACALFALGAGTAIALPAQTLTTLHSFQSVDGENPTAALVQATDGNLYGTTAYGGIYSDNCPGSGTPADGCGTVFRIAPSGMLTTLHSFKGTDGENPIAGMIQATNGDLYGTTAYGGSFGWGTIFKITPSGTLTTLYSFCQGGVPKCTDGAVPFAGLVQAIDENLYGTTYYGGASTYGTIFKITPAGIFTTVYTFCSQVGCTPFGGPQPDGENPSAGLVQAANGNLYGTAANGGAYGYGTVFQINSAGTLTTLHSFAGSPVDGGHPSAGLVQAASGDFYGTTPYGSASLGGGTIGGGTIFKITSGGTLTTLYNFCAQSNCTDGEEPIAGLVQATDGDFYGTTSFGGYINCTFNVGCGTVFRITPTGTLTTLYNFCAPSGCTDNGQRPSAGLVQDTNGDFYGTTTYAGTGGTGTVFRLSTGLHPFVETQPTSGKVGSAVKILGTNLTGATSVSFNGAAAVFKVVSSSEIMATVPAGASSGRVQVITPGDTLSSKARFRVTP